MPHDGSAAPSPRGHFHRLWKRHGRLFWILHSVWALGSGIAVLWVAHERFDFVFWVVGFLALTWASTWFFSQPAGASSAGFGFGLASYLRRVMYQETLFFLLPLYAYSTVIPSRNLAFPALLAGLAILACLDLVFDRWLRSSPVLSLVFFAAVAFGALNLLLPVLFSVDPALATPVAAALAVATSLPLAVRGRHLGLGSWTRVGATALVILGVAVWLPQLVPPAPLRLKEAAFGATLDRSTLELLDPLADGARGDALHGEMVVLARVFAPARVPSQISLDWYRDDSLVRRSREVAILAHEGGFRFWDALRPESGVVPPGVYRVVLHTADNRLFGTASIRIH